MFTYNFIIIFSTSMCLLHLNVSSYQGNQSEEETTTPAGGPQLLASSSSLRSKVK